MVMEKITLGALVLALSSNGCSVAASHNTALNPSNIENKNLDKSSDSFDSIDDYVDVSKLSNLLASTYMVISESEYTAPSGKIETFHSLGSSELYKDIKDRTYLVTANHVVDNEDEMFDFFGRKYTKKSETFYLLEDDQVHVLQRALRVLTQSKVEDRLYLMNRYEQKQELNMVIRTSESMKALLSLIKPRKVRVDAANESKDIAIISVKDLRHNPIAYDIGDAQKIKAQNIVFVTGWPLGLVKNLNRGFVTYENDSFLVEENPKSRFIFDASISPGNSGGGIYAFNKDRFKLIGVTSAMYRGGNDLYIGIKINAVSDIFKGDSITCSKGWECNKSLPYEIKL